MKSKSIKKFLALMTTAAMTFGGFGNFGGAATVFAEEDPFSFESVSDVTFPLKEKLELTVFVYATNTGGGTFQTNYVTDYIEEKTNIHLNFVYDLDGDDAKTLPGIPGRVLLKKNDREDGEEKQEKNNIPVL